MMRVPISAGFIIYILVAVISAVIKRLVTQQVQSEKRSSPPEPSAVGEREEAWQISDPEVEQYFPESDSPKEKALWSDQSDENGLWGGERAEIPPLRPKKSGPGVQWAAHNFTQAVIMSEIIRRPRAQRPWPSR